ncbi:hypothetical protein BES34_017085 [Leptospira inadai serovar Lyme]|uniref:Uncharacterized protein n=1 Tax=Leptospira inadai serovar Lyme TaxID=293084 RepID=A0ABX4YF11_9LEPT|nr:hypothetical protein BES34_017085 [Leptospira inadai serovar Lyme]
MVTVTRRFIFVRGRQRTEDRGQRTEDRGQRTENYSYYPDNNFFKNELCWNSYTEKKGRGKIQC